MSIRFPQSNPATHNSFIRLGIFWFFGSLVSIFCLAFTVEADDQKKSSLHSTFSASQLAFFEDPNLQRCVVQIAETNHWTRAEQISGRIDCRKHGISLLSGIEALANITSLDLSINYISDISPLSKLQKLEVLKLSFNTVADLRPLLTLKQLKILDIGHNMVNDITALANLYRLNNLNLQNNLITDVTALKSLTEMQFLNLAVNNITNINALAQLVNLQYLSLLYNEVTDIHALENLTNLQGLNLGGNKIRNADSIANLIRLSNLNLSDNGLHSGHSTIIGALATLPALQHLDLTKNRRLSCTVLNHLISELNTLNTVVFPPVAQNGDTCSAP